MNPPDPVINVRIISLGGRRSRVLPTDSAGVEPRLGRGPTEVPTWFITSPSPERRRLWRSFCQQSQRQLDSLY